MESGTDQESNLIGIGSEIIPSSPGGGDKMFWAIIEMPKVD